jgi:hypothetical protein
MGFGTSLFLIAVGAILAFAVEIEVQGFDLNTVGIILMIVGVVGMIASVAFWGSWGGFGGARRRTVVEDEAYAPPSASRRTVVEGDAYPPRP